MLRLSHITKSFDTGAALNDVSFSVGAGEFFAVLGPSGSGKTSLLNVVAGLINPDSGTVEINDVNMTQTPPNKRNIGMVFQNFFVYPHLNVYENIRYPLRYASTYKKADIPKKVQEIVIFHNHSPT